MTNDQKLQEFWNGSITGLLKTKKLKRVPFKALGITSTPWKKDKKAHEQNKKTLDNFFSKF